MCMLMCPRAVLGLMSQGPRMVHGWHNLRLNDCSCLGLPYTVCRGFVYGVYTPYPVYTYTVPRIYRFSPRPGTRV